MKKVLAILLAACLALSLAACGGSGSSAPVSTAPDTSGSAAADGSIAVFYYTYSDTYISTVRTALDAELDKLGVEYQDYDSNSQQNTQTEQVDTAITKGATCLIVNIVETGSDDAAQGIVDKAKAADIPVIFFNREVSDAYDELSKNYNEFADMAEFYNSNACVASDGNDYYHTYACEDWDRQAFYIFNTAYAENELGLKPCPKCR